jgi:hypothetical protein
MLTEHAKDPFGKPETFAMSRDLRRPELCLPALAVLALATLLLGCGGSKDTGRANNAPVRSAPTQEPTSSRATVRSGDLTVTLTATPPAAKAGSPVRFDLTAYASHAPGALGYRLQYGDGTSAAESAVPLFCFAGRGAPMRGTWRLSHRYRTAGRYRVSASVSVNCTSDHATATVTVNVT